MTYQLKGVLNQLLVDDAIFSHGWLDHGVSRATYSELNTTYVCT